MKFLTFEPLRTFTYEEYLLLAEKTANEEIPLKDALPPEKAAAIKINFQRMKRLNKTIVLKNEIYEKVKQLEGKMQWIVIAETWCGDGAQNIPILAKIAFASDKLDLKIILRDENPEIMDAFLTNGTRSIPILICIDIGNNKLIGTWGPRPKKIQKLFSNYKKDNPEISHDELLSMLHLWYAKDKGEALQDEFIDLLKDWNSFKP